MKRSRGSRDRRRPADASGARAAPGRKAASREGRVVFPARPLGPRAPPSARNYVSGRVAYADSCSSAGRASACATSAGFLFGSLKRSQACQLSYLSSRWGGVHFKRSERAAGKRIRFRRSRPAGADPRHPACFFTGHTPQQAGVAGVIHFPAFAEFAGVETRLHHFAPCAVTHPR